MASDGIAAQFTELNQLYKEEESIYHELAAAAGLSDAAHWILYSICRSEKRLSQFELCDMLSCSKQTVNSAVSSLARLDYIELAADAGKRKEIRLTQKGRALCRRSIQPLIEAEEEAFAQFSGAEREQFLSLFRRMLAALRHTTAPILDIKP